MSPFTSGLRGLLAHRRDIRMARPSRRRFGFWVPVPHYTTRTRRGSQTSVGGCGCCLPIPLLVVVSAAGAVRTLSRRTR
jgi:hypothetical protein